MTPQEIDIKELCRYLGYGKNEPDERTKAAIRSVIDEYIPCVRERHVTLEVPITVGADGVALPGGYLPSKSLARTLDGCECAVIMAATLGAECDRLMMRYESSDMAKAAIAQACGACAIEVLCDRICADIEQVAALRGLYSRRRFSPGYGDLPLETQNFFIAALDAQKKIGLTLTSSLMMVPTKSVTAIVGLSAQE